MKGIAGLLDSPAAQVRTAFEALAATEETAGSVAGLSIDGMRCFASLVVDEEEGRRRRRFGLEAVTDRRLLHALWTLPEDVPVPWAGIDPFDADTLGRSRGVIEDDGVTARRSYRPAGHVAVVAVVARRLGTAVERVGEFPPIFQRVAVATHPRPPTRSDVDLALCYGIGAVQVSDPSGVVLAKPAAPQLGIPTVYRWWVSELAYREVVSNYTDTV